MTGAQLRGGAILRQEISGAQRAPARWVSRPTRTPPYCSTIIGVLHWGLQGTLTAPGFCTGVGRHDVILAHAPIGAKHISSGGQPRDAPAR